MDTVVVLGLVEVVVLVDVLVDVVVETVVDVVVLVQVLVVEVCRILMVSTKVVVKLPYVGFVCDTTPVE